MWDNAYFWTGLASVAIGVGLLALGVRSLLNHEDVEDRRQRALRFVGAVLCGVVLGIVAMWVILPSELWAQAMEGARRIF